MAKDSDALTEQELQIQILALKKAAKRYKTKKKVLRNEIAQLEQGLKARHMSVLQEINKNQELAEIQDQCTECNEVVEDLRPAKVSKAQKRRDKKSQLERERAELIKLEDKENLKGPRHIENQALIARMKRKNLQLFMIPTNGDCLYNTVEHQLNINSGTTETDASLREKVYDCIRSDKDDTYPFMSNPDTCDMLTDIEFEEYCDALTLLETRHKKEKKELQAQIQALKKAAKHFKTKKKVLRNEIAQLEQGLKARHISELEELKKNQELEEIQDQEIAEIQDQCTECNEVIEDGRPAKVSKAQKRRDKKAQLERERAELIKLQEKENLNGPRHIENQALIARLKSKNLKLFMIPTNGDCLYNAVIHQLNMNTGTTETVASLRKKVSDYIRSNKDDFYPFMSNPDTCDMLTDLEFEEYCDETANANAWGGQLEICALSSILKRHIQVIQATGPESIDQGSEFEGPTLVISYHRHLYSLGEHFNSTQPVDLENEDEDE